MPTTSINVGVPQLKIDDKSVVTTGGIKLHYTKKFMTGLLVFKLLTPLSLEKLPRFVSIKLLYPLAARGLRQDHYPACKPVLVRTSDSEVMPTIQLWVIELGAICEVSEVD